MRKGRFITLEGVEGVGKSTCLRTVMAVLECVGIEFVSTREPGGTALGESLRGLLLDAKIEAISEDAELLMMFAARAEHIAKVIEPALLAGKWVLCDRFTDATYAYQGGGRSIPEDRIAAIEAWVHGGLQPDLTILLDAPVEVGLQRARHRGELDRFEQESIDFFNGVRQAYLGRAEVNPQRFRVVAAAQDIDSVQSEVELIVREFASECSISG